MKRLMLCALLLACGKPDKADKTDKTDKTDKPKVEGRGDMKPTTAATWKGTWTRTDPMPGGGAMTLTIGASGKATVTAETSLCIKPNTPIIVNIAADQVSMQVEAGDTHATYGGKIDGNKMTGTMVVTCAPGTGKGTFELTKQ